MQSVVITNGKRTVVEHGGDEDVKENKLIKSILDHEIYSKKLEGVERTNGILGELLEMDMITEQEHEKLFDTELKMNTVNQVEKVIAKVKETN